METYMNKLEYLNLELVDKFYELYNIEELDILSVYDIMEKYINEYKLSLQEIKDILNIHQEMELINYNTKNLNHYYCKFLNHYIVNYRDKQLKKLGI